ncbi:MAG TPA: hypothetical protein VGW38_17665 [Chloroflexota bacterium]|nr:hypothetical protein [Chloroflexota bacterium]
MTVKERMLRRIAEMDEETLERLEAQLDELKQPSGEIERRLRAWRGVFGMLSDPEEYAEFEKRAERRHLFFGGEVLDLESDEENSGPEKNEL